MQWKREDLGQAGKKNNCGSSGSNSNPVNDFYVNSDIMVVPNPNKGVFQLKIPDNIYEECNKIEIVNTIGQSFYIDSSKNQNLNLKIPQGLYFLLVHTKNNIFYSKFYIQ